jgi:tRNA(Ile)-lysidine synthase
MSRGPGRLRHLVGQAIQDHGLWETGNRVAVAVSGGLDSVCLLDLLQETRRWHGASLEVVTIDHGARPDSAADADHVVQWARDLQLEVTRFDLALSPDSSEAQLRDARYACFETLDVDHVALAHHRDDQAETVLLRLIRGAGATGLSGMAWRRGQYVRPLLGVTRVDLEKWAEHRELRWCEDPSNRDPRFLRNRIRREVIPLLESLRPGASGAIARAGSNLARDNAALNALVPTKFDVAWLREADRAIAARAVLALAPNASSAHIDAILARAEHGRGVVELPGGSRLIVKDGVISHHNEG